MFDYKSLCRMAQGIDARTVYVAMGESAFAAFTTDDDDSEPHTLARNKIVAMFDSNLPPNQVLLYNIDWTLLAKCENGPPEEAPEPGKPQVA